MNFPDLIMFGIQGSGKGVQNTLLAQKYPAYQVLDLGMVFRAQAQTDSDLGRNIKKQIDQGNIVSIEDYAAVLAEIMQNSDPNTHFIFDGFVRTLAQKDIFEKATAERRVIGINLLLAPEKAIERLSKRFICPGIDPQVYRLLSESECRERGYLIARRKDDEPEAIRQRIASFYDQTIPVIDWYRSQDRLLEVEADLEPTEIHQNICQKLEYYQ